MLELTPEILVAVAAAALTLFVVQCALALAVSVALRSAGKERTQATKELFGLVRRIETLTADRREQVLEHYDRLLQTLANRLPAMVAAQASQQIFETERRVLQRLAELEPDLKNDHASRQKMDDLIRSMESLESTVIHVTADAVEKVLLEGRRELIGDAGLASRAA